MVTVDENKRTEFALPLLPLLPAVDAEVGTLEVVEPVVDPDTDAPSSAETKFTFLEPGRPFNCQQSRLVWPGLPQ